MVTVGVLQNYTQENTFLLLFWWNRIQYPSAQTIQSWQYYLFLHAARLQETEQGQEGLEVNFLFKAVNSARYLKMYSTLSMNSCIDFSKIIHM